MEWTSLTREDLDEIIFNGLKSMDDAVQEAWKVMRIEPEKWRCSPWDDEGGGFWVVAEQGGQVVWYNDIEDGFNISRFTTRGIIAEYACDQTSFEEFLLRLPEAREAEQWPVSQKCVAVPFELQAGGAIVRRQTTYWDLRAGQGSLWRVRFKAKTEVRFVTAQFTKLELAEVHAILSQYLEPWAQLYFTGTAIDSLKLKQAISEIVAAESDGWRTLEYYINRSADLAKGYGQLMRAPRTIVVRTANLLEEMGIRASIIDEAAPRNPPGAVLLMDKNIIVAGAFRFERLEAP